MNDIVKSIVLRFKGDTKDLKDIEQALTRINKTADGVGGKNTNGGLNKMLKDLVNLNKEFGKIGAQLPQSMDRVGRTVKEIASVHLRDAQRRLEEMSDKAERRLKKLQELEKSGASSSRLGRAQRLAAGSIGQTIETGDLVKDLSRMAGGGGGGQPPGGGFFGGLGRFIGPASAGSAIANAPGATIDFVSERLRANMNNPAIAMSPYMDLRRAGYEGDLTNSVLARTGGLKRMRDYSSRQRKLGAASDYTGLFGGAGMALLGAGLTAAGMGLSATGVGAVAGIPMTTIGAGMAAAGTGMALTGAYNAFGSVGKVTDRFTGARGEAQAAQAYQEAKSAESARNLDVQLYQRFRETAVGRAKFQRTMGLSSGEAFGLRQDAGDLRMTEEEMASVSSGLRTRFGNVASRAMALTAGRTSLQSGMTLDASTQLTAAMGMNFGGGASSKNMEELMSRSVAAGVIDSGLKEALTRGIMMVGEGSPSRISAGAAFGAFAQFLPSGERGAPIDPRSLAGAEQAYNFERQRFSASNPQDDTLKRSVFMKALRSKGMPVNLSDIDYFRSLSTPEQVASSEYLGNMGFNETERSKLAQDFRTAMSGVSPEENRIVNQARSAKKPLPDSMLAKLAVAQISATQGAEGLKGRSQESLVQQGKAFLESAVPGAAFESGPTMAAQVAAISPEERNNLANAEKAVSAARMRVSGEAAQEQAIIRGRQELDKDISTQVAPYAGQDAVGMERALQAAGTGAGTERDPLEAAGKAIQAMDNFADSLNMLNDNISRMNGRYKSAVPGQ